MQKEHGQHIAESSSSPKNVYVCICMSLSVIFFSLIICYFNVSLQSSHIPHRGSGPQTLELDGGTTVWQQRIKTDGRQSTSPSALYVREQLECIELGPGANEERVESLWVRIKGQAHKGDITVDVYYRPPDQEEVDEAFYKQLKAASQSQAWFLWGTSTTLTSAGKTTQPGTCNPEGSCRASMINFWCKWWSNQQGKVLCWTLY